MMQLRQEGVQSQQSKSEAYFCAMEINRRGGHLLPPTLGEAQVEVNKMAPICGLQHGGGGRGGRAGSLA